MGHHCLLVFTRESSSHGFLGGAGFRPSAVVLCKGRWENPLRGIARSGQLGGDAWQAAQVQDRESLTERGCEGSRLVC